MREDNSPAYFNPFPVVRSDTVDTNATAPNLPGPGRTLGLLLDLLGSHLESFLNKRATKRGLGPEAAARGIRLLRRHHDMTIPERYSVSWEQLSKEEKKVLRKRCRVLVRYARSSLLSTQLLALEEITTLSFEDPIIRTILRNFRLDTLVAKYKEPDLLVAAARAFASITNTTAHALWTTTFLRFVSTNDEKCTELDWSALADSISVPESSFIAARYLSRVLQLKTTVKRFFTPFVDLFGRYVEAATKIPSEIEWSTLNTCIRNFTLSSPCIPFFSFEDRVFTPPHGEARVFASNMVREIRHVPDFFSDYFAAPRFEVATSDSKFDGSIKLTSVSDRHLDRLANLCVKFLTALSGSEDIAVHLSCIQNFDAAARKLLEGTVLVKEVFVVYCHLHRFSEFSPRMLFGSCTSEIHRLLSASARLTSYLDGTAEDRALSIFLGAKFASMSRYHKLVISFAENQISRPFPYSTDLSERVNRLVTGNYAGVAPNEFETQRVFRIKDAGVCRRITYATSCDIEILQHNIAKACPGRDLSIDVLTYTERTVMPLEVDGRKSPFRVTGHYPILAGYDWRGNELYIARVPIHHTGSLVRYRYAFVKDGASSVTLADVFGCLKTRVTYNFDVLVLRHNPSDMPLGLAKGTDGSMDPTGPLFWQKARGKIKRALPGFAGEWPRKSCKSESLDCTLRRVQSR